jgi:hypothetical protein
MGKNLEGRGRGLILRNFPGIRIEVLRRNTNISQDSRFPGRDLNARPSEYERGILTTIPLDHNVSNSKHFTLRAYPVPCSKRSGRGGFWLCCSRGRRPSVMRITLRCRRYVNTVIISAYAFPISPRGKALCFGSEIRVCSVVSRLGGVVSLLATRPKSAGCLNSHFLRPFPTAPEESVVTV